MDDFQNLVNFLRLRGFTLNLTTMRYEDGPRASHFRGHGIVGMIGDYGYASSYLDGRIVADNAGCFNKPADCPLVMRLPTTDEARDRLLEYFRFLRSNAGYDHSRSFDFDDNPRMPYDPWTPESG